MTAVKAVSLAPSEGEWVDDGDENPDTDTYLLPVDCVIFAHWMSITASSCPYLNETNLPACWSMSGGVTAPGSPGRLTRYIHTGDVGKHTITVVAGCSTKTVTIIVYKAEFGLYADEGDRTLYDVGHSWWKFSLQPEEAKDYVHPPRIRMWIDEAGYWPRTTINPITLNAEGVVNLGDQDHPATGSHVWTISFWKLCGGLNWVENLSDEPGTFNLLFNNCTTKAIELGRDLPITDIWWYSGIYSPWDLSDLLNAEPYELCE